MNISHSGFVTHFKQAQCKKTKNTNLFSFLFKRSIMKPR